MPVAPLGAWLWTQGGAGAVASSGHSADASSNFGSDAPKMARIKYQQGML